MEINSSLYPNNMPSVQANIPKDTSAVSADIKQAAALPDALPNLVKATVANLIRDELTLTLPNGSDIFAKAANMKNLSIGLEAQFNLSSDQSGNIIASLAENSNLAENIANSALTQALNTLGIKTTPENMNIANLLLQNEFPITKENFSLLNRAMIMNGNSPDKAMFFMNNSVPLTSKNVMQLDSYVNHQTELSSQLDTLMENISSLPDTQLKDKLLSLFPFAKQGKEVMTESENGTQTLQSGEKMQENIEGETDVFKMPSDGEIAEKEIAGKEITVKNRANPALPENNKENTEEALKKDIVHKAKAFSMRPKDISSDKVNEFFNKLSESLSLAKKLLAESNTQQGEQISKNIDSVRENIDFMSALKNTQLLQIPVTINNMETTADLYVFTNKKNQRKSNGKSANAQLSLDLAFLGHLEVYIQKKSSDVNCQFRIENDDIEMLIKSNIDKLTDYLNDYSLKLSGCSFKTLDTPFTLTDDESTLDSSLENKIQNISFDMRT
ncbi:MAG: flagellar hook-length control protein FliK [Firmicutes bacterium]|nr:flagellar hook-length control protein FliK [Bacillota bacterium]